MYGYIFQAIECYELLYVSNGTYICHKHIETYYYRLQLHHITSLTPYNTHSLLATSLHNNINHLVNA